MLDGTELELGNFPIAASKALLADSRGDTGIFAYAPVLIKARDAAMAGNVMNVFIFMDYMDKGWVTSTAKWDDCMTPTEF